MPTKSNLTHLLLTITYFKYTETTPTTTIIAFNVLLICIFKSAGQVEMTFPILGFVTPNHKFEGSRFLRHLFHVIGEEMLID